MDELARMMVNEGWSADDIQAATGLDENELAKIYLEEGHSIEETADEIGIDEKDLEDEYGDKYELVL